jgi:hypothetical protein
LRRGFEEGFELEGFELEGFEWEGFEWEGFSYEGKERLVGRLGGRGFV